MGESFIIQRSSSAGGDTQFAVIIANCPEGSTCTCTDGTISISFSNTNGQVVFNIPSTGTWTVTATDGTDSKSKSVSITEEGQFEIVNVYYKYRIIENGESIEGYGTLTCDFYTDTDSNGENYAHVGYGGDSWIGTGYYYYLVDVTEFSTLYADGLSNYFNGGNGLAKFGVGTTSETSYTASSTLARDRGVCSLDVSSYSGKVYIIISAGGYDDDTQGWQGTGARVYNMWLQ